uniref:Uncharacterized protein n=1 Tax=Euplotes harpa TaxID=151035 RepID=A0A7S3N4N3_9SPIT|mmetsp:Transcript_1079/g.1058  ORF Transcript_1079/g.1058 Transcript_1079/m.1058 type:complete len:124 (+) Transcript_1079:761-1132(+)
MLTTQKSSKRKSSERDTIKSKHKRSASDGTRILSSKSRKKEQMKSSPIHSAYYNKMIATFNNTGNLPTKTLRKALNKTNKIYYDQNYNSKSNDERQNSTNIRSVPLSLMNSFEKNLRQEKGSK